MKKIIALLLAIAAIILTMTSCGNDGYVEYKNDDIGLSYTIFDDMEEPFVSPNKITTQNDEGTVFFVINWFENSTLESVIGQKNFSVSAYVNFAINDLGIVDATDVKFNREGTRATFEISTAQTEDEIPQYLFNLILKGAENIYVIQFGCLESDREIYEAEFKDLATKIYTY